MIQLYAGFNNKNTQKGMRQQKQEKYIEKVIKTY